MISEGRHIRSGWNPPSALLHSKLRTLCHRPNFSVLSTGWIGGVCERLKKQGATVGQTATASSPPHRLDTPAVQSYDPQGER